MDIQEDTATFQMDSIRTDSLAGEFGPSQAASKSSHAIPETETNSAPANFFHTEYSADMPLKPRIANPESWISPLLLLLFFFSSILATYFRKELGVLLSSPFRKDGMRKLIDEENFIVRRTLLTMLLIFLIALPILLYQTMAYTGVVLESPLDLPLYIQLLGICAGLIGLKLVAVNLIGSLFQCQREADIYTNGMMLMFGLAGLLLIPACLLIQLVEEPFMAVSIRSTWIMVGVLYIGSLFTGASAVLGSQTVSRFHLFLYFCTLEILPGILIVKIVRNLALQG